MNNVYGIESVEQLSIEPGTERYYDYPADFYISEALSMAYEWKYAANPHTYCHERNILVGLLREIERLRAKERPAP